MKTTLKIATMAVLAFTSINTFAQSTSENSTDEKPVKKHLTIVKIEDGVKTELDTVITGDDSRFFFNGGMDEFEWEGDMPTMPDSLMMRNMRHFRFEGRPDGKGPHHEMHVFRDLDDQKDIQTFEFVDGDSTRHMMFIHNGDRRPDMLNFGGPEAPMPPHAPAMMHFKSQRMGNNTNVIRLDSPDIISYKKKTMKDGTEKIEIVRKQPTQKQVDVKAEVHVEDENTK